MRYKVVADAGQPLYERILQLLSDRDVTIRLKNDKRRMVAVEDPPEDVRLELVRLGARVGEDAVYSTD